ncbi:hypothetical protein B7R87_16235 [Streptomyces tsukubensis]|nr:hypothetical protein B7R87_16235 [Streptomyces tsukubensis]
MGEVDLGHATTAEHRAQFVPAAEATRLFHTVPALSVSPHRTRLRHRTRVRSGRCAAPAYATGPLPPDRPVTVS